MPEETTEPTIVDEESSSSGRPSPMETIDIIDVPPKLERMASTSSSTSPVPARSKSPGDQTNNTNEESIPDSTSNGTNNKAVDESRKNDGSYYVDGTNLTESFLLDSSSSRGKRASRQLTKVREMDKELAAWINGFHADNKLDELTREMITDRARQIARQKKILDFSGTANWYTRFLGRNFSDSAVSKQLKMLSFANPGKFMEDFDPERSAREMRKMNRRIYRENVKKNQMYDETGRMLDNSKDVCDCLDEDCPGCHFPCPKCGSEKCGTECRCNRKWVYEIVEIEGTNLVIKNPSLS